MEEYVLSMRRIPFSEEQNIQVDILRFLDLVCKKEKLNYYLAYGTLIGAIREGKIIEWDDDIDVWMPRADSERLAEVFEKYNTENKYFLQTTITEKWMPAPGMYRICVNGTCKWNDKIYKNAKFNTGIYFDIFPLDYAPENILIEKIKSNICRICNTLIYLKIYDECTLYTMKDKIVKMLSTILPYRVLSLVVTNIYRTKKLNKNRFICYPSSVIYPNNVFDTTDYDVIFVDFEGLSCPCPKGYDRILTARYGEWRIPNNTKQKCESAYYIP